MDSVCEKIDAFEKHVFDRQLRIAQILGDHFTKNAEGDPLAQSAFAVMSLCLNYFEMIEQFAMGQSSNSNSPEFFKRGFQRVFPNSEFTANEISRIYGLLRCGLYHTAMPKGRCGLTRELHEPIKVSNGDLLINPSLLVDSIIAHFEQFCCALRDGQHCELQSNFETMWDSIAQRGLATGTVTSPSIPTTPEPTRLR